MDILLNVLVCFGLTAVGLAFIVLLPTVGQTLVAVFGTVVGEQAFAKFKGQESGTVMADPISPGQPEAPPVDDHDHDGHHEPLPARVYIGVYVALLMLTVATVGVSEMGLPMHLSIFWAVVVASTKATLVVAWFMHMKGGPAMNKVALGAGMFFMAAFFTLTMMDLGSRDLYFEESSPTAIANEAIEAGETPKGWSTTPPSYGGE